MAKKFKSLRAKMTNAALARAEAKTKAMLVEISLKELRQARGQP